MLQRIILLLCIAQCAAWAWFLLIGFVIGSNSLGAGLAIVFAALASPFLVFTVFALVLAWQRIYLGFALAMALIGLAPATLLLA